MKRVLLALFIIHHSLFISTAGARDYSIVDYGAKADTTVLSTAAVQQAIDACSAAGGGRVVVPSGDYKIGSIQLRSNVHLYLELGASLYGSTRIEDYRPMKSDYVSLRTQTTTIQLIYADKANHVTISGQGVTESFGPFDAFETEWNNTLPEDLQRFLKHADLIHPFFHGHFSSLTFYLYMDGLMRMLDKFQKSRSVVRSVSGKAQTGI